MKYLRITFLVMLVTVFANCKKSGGDGGTNNNSTAPTNLSINTTISTDNSGNVVFTASANNAVTYDYDFGDGTFQTVPAGVVTYKYLASGTYNVTVVAKSAGGKTLSKSTSVIVVVSQTLVWSEEFDNNGAPDPTKWGYDLGTGDNGWGNSELEYYTNRADNVIVSGGTLKITAKKETFNGSAYTSARIVTRDKFSFQYGKLEIKAKLPAGVGTWPAIWTLGADFATNPWPACGEMDIMEHRGSELNKIFGTLHYPGHSGGNGNGKTTVISNATTEFHVYALEWSPASVKISVDGNVFLTVANDSSLPFNHKFFIILNVAMGGTFAGAVDPAFNSAAMEVDYVRLTSN